jgi:hypothetical protein
MLLEQSNIFMGCSTCLVFDLQWAPGISKIWGVVTNPWTLIRTLVNFDSRSSYRRIGNHRSDTSVRTKLINFTFDRIIASFSCSVSFFTDVTGLVMCSIWKDHLMTSIFVLYTLLSRRWVTDFLQSNKNLLHLVLIGRDIHTLVLSDNLNGHGSDWMHLL